MKFEFVDEKEQKIEKKSQKEQEISPEVEIKKSQEIEPSKKLKIGAIELIDESLKRVSSKLERIRETLNKLEITQDDIWFFIRYLTRHEISSFRESKKDLTPIFLDFINKKLK